MSPAYRQWWVGIRGKTGVESRYFLVPHQLQVKFCLSEFDPPYINHELIRWVKRTNSLNLNALEKIGGQNKV